MHTAHLINISNAFRTTIMVAVFDFSPYSSALLTSLAQVQGLLMIFTVWNTTALKVDGAREDILLII